MSSSSAVSVWPADVARVEVAPGLAYWTVLSGPTLEPVRPIDHYLRHLRFGRGRAESTTKTYAGHLKRFEQWRHARDLSWEQAAREIAGHLIDRRITPRTTPGRGQGRRPSDAALAPALAAMHGFYRHAADVGDVDRLVLPVLFEVAELDIPGRSGPLLALWPRLRVDARPSYPAYLGPSQATAEELAALLGQPAPGTPAWSASSAASGCGLASSPPFAARTSTWCHLGVARPAAPSGTGRICMSSAATVIPVGRPARPAAPTCCPCQRRW